jgi:peptidoglycan/LPS O-acetylase OafA/YrhL
MLLCRLGKLIRIPNAFGWCSLILILAFSIPRIGNEQQLWMNGLYETVVVICIFPLVLSMGAGGTLHQPRAARFCKFLGDISYPLYISHYPIVYTYTGWIVRNKIPLSPKALLVGSLVPVLSISLAYAYLKLYDEPVREWLRKKYLATRTGRTIVSLNH